MAKLRNGAGSLLVEPKLGRPHEFKQMKMTRFEHIKEYGIPKSCLVFGGLFVLLLVVPWCWPHGAIKTVKRFPSPDRKTEIAISTEERDGVMIGIVDHIYVRPFGSNDTSTKVLMAKGGISFPKSINVKWIGDHRVRVALHRFTVEDARTFVTVRDPKNRDQENILYVELSVDP